MPAEIPGPLPPWAARLVLLYESQAASQFILHGNVDDRLLLPAAGGPAAGSLTDFLLQVLLPRFDVVLSYDLGNGARVEKGGEIFGRWPGFEESRELLRAPRSAVEALTRFFRYAANLARMGQPALHVGCIVRSAHLVVPAAGAGSYEQNALALLVRDWGTDDLLTRYPLATFLLTESLNDLHPLLVNNPRAPAIKLPLPSPREIAGALRLLAPRCPIALSGLADLDATAGELAGSSLAAVESLLKVKEHRREPLAAADLTDLKKQIVETEANGLIDFVPAGRTLDALHGQEALKAWLREDVALWQRGEVNALPKGYLLCGPVGTGKTFLAECLAGEAGVPVVTLKNFRDKWVGSTEGNLEKIFRLLRALGRCFVFIDEADQALGRRDSGGNDAGLSGRVYSMIAQEMSDPATRGKVIWILASSRPDLIEVDLKRPGRIDLKIPLFPAATPEEGLALIRSLCSRHGLRLEDDATAALVPLVPPLLTPASAEAIAFRAYRAVKTRGTAPAAAVEDHLRTYQSPVPAEVMAFQIRLAVEEATDLSLVPAAFRPVQPPRPT